MAIGSDIPGATPMAENALMEKFIGCVTVRKKLHTARWKAAAVAGQRSCSSPVSLLTCIREKENSESMVMTLNFV